MTVNIQLKKEITLLEEEISEIEANVLKYDGNSHAKFEHKLLKDKLQQLHEKLDKTCKKKKPSINKYKRKAKYKTKMKKKFELHHFLISKKENKEGKEYYVSFNKKNKKHIRKTSNRKVRYTKKQFKNIGSNYKKLYDYMWELD